MESYKAVEERTRITNKKHPFKEANVFSKVFFTWNIPFFYNGFKRNLNEEDLYPPLDTHNSKILGDKLEAAWQHELKTKRYPSLWRALWIVFRKDLIILGLIQLFIEMVLRLIQPLALGEFLKYYQPNSTVTKNQAYIYATVIVIGTLLNSIFLNNVVLQILHVGMKLRVACCAVIYRKALRLSNSSLAETTIGQMVNLLTNDVNRFDLAAIHVNGLWITPLLLILTMYLIAAYVEFAAFSGIGFLLLFIPIQFYLGSKASEFRFKTAIRTDERIRLMNEIISGIQVIKMYTWEKPFAKLVEISRRKEIKQILANSIIRSITLSFMLVLSRAAIYFCVLTYVLLGNTLTSQYVYVTTSFYEVLRPMITMFFPQALIFVAEAKTSVNRIRTFLLYDEMTVVDQSDQLAIKNVSNDYKLTELSNNLKTQNSEAIVIKDASTKWIQSSTDNSLEGINLKIYSNELVAIVGPVGSGKTTLLHLILRELTPNKGTVKLNGTISYASQEPWLFTGSIKQNILFGQDFVPFKYQEVVRVCALSRDFALLPYGDRDRVGERGVTLSGGQKARINLARAIYKEADIYLLDDPLSAVDTHVGKPLFDKCIVEYLSKKCVVLVTHQLQYLQNTKKIVLLENGKIEAIGTYGELKASGRAFTNLLDSVDEQEKETQENKRQSSRKPSERPDEEIPEDEPEQEKEAMNTGNIKWKTYKTYIFAGGHFLIPFMLILVFIIVQLLCSGVDYFVTFWVNLEQSRSEGKVLYNATVDNSTYEMTTTHPETFYDWFFTEQNLLIIYSVLVFFGTTLALSRSSFFYMYSMKISKILHDSMFKVIVHATMKFFNTNPSGRILNRFAKDMGYIDESLPMSILGTVQVGLMVAASTVIITTVNPWVLLPCFVMLIIFYLIRSIFVATSRDIKRLEGVTRSPIYSHLTASLQSLTTIRSFGAQEILTQEFDNYQNAYSGAYYMFLGATRTFGFWLDMHCVVFVALVTYGFLFMDTETFWGMRQWSEMENQMTSVERIKEYIDLIPEVDKPTTNPPKGWPENGNVKFDRLSLRYSSTEPYVLKDLSFQIKSTEKVGIVGRTGAGKSSLIVALFRLAETEGSIFIDDINTNDISLTDLRSKISIIPQEPILFSGTLRKNLDPFDEYDDSVCYLCHQIYFNTNVFLILNSVWNALEEVELKSLVSDLPRGLQSKMSEGGSNFSVGQRQLVCLARAIIRNNKILVLDEATANVDPQTDALIQSKIREKFANCTVLTIVHRLHTIMDADKVLVMDAGQVAQFDHPHRLLENREGVFFKLVEQTGKGMAANLAAIAEESYKAKKDRWLNDSSGKINERCEDL